MYNKVVNFNHRVATPNDLMTIKDFAALHGCSVNFVYKLNYKGLLHFYKRGKNKVSESEALRVMEL